MIASVDFFSVNHVTNCELLSQTVILSSLVSGVEILDYIYIYICIKSVHVGHFPYYSTGSNFPQL